MTAPAESSADAFDVVPDTESTVETESPAPIVITEQEVAFATAAVSPLPSSTTGWWTAAIHTVHVAACGLLTSRTDPGQPRRHYPPRWEPLEDARMEREMHRL
jgi:hypothetical protein